MSEAKVSALIVALLTGVGLALMLTAALRDVWTAIGIGGAVALVMGVGLAIFATDEVKRRDKKSPKGKSQ